MSDVFDEEDAELVLQLYLKSPSVIARFVHFRATDEKTRLHIARLEHMRVITILQLDEEDATYAAKYAGIETEFYVTLHPDDHPDVKAIIDAMELL